MSTVYRATPVGSGYQVAVFVERGEVIRADNEFVVRTPNGDLVSVLGWHMHEADAWVAAGDELDRLSRHLAGQAAGCRQRAGGEVA